MCNKHVQEKLCPEPKEDPAKALQYAIAFEEAIRRPQTIGQPSVCVKVKKQCLWFLFKKMKENAGDAEQKILRQHI